MTWRRSSVFGVVLACLGLLVCNAAVAQEEVLGVVLYLVSVKDVGALGAKWSKPQPFIGPALDSAVFLVQPGTGDLQAIDPGPGP